MEEQYLQVVRKHSTGTVGERGIDVFVRLFAHMIEAMEQSRGEIKDVLGDLFAASVIDPRSGQFLTPEPVCRLMAKLTIDAAADPDYPAADGGHGAPCGPPDDTAAFPQRDTEAEAEQPQALDAPPLRILDPCCGSGRMLLAAAEINRHWLFCGQDVDRRCVHMTAINLALRNLAGWVIWGDSMKNERRLVYRTGFNGRGFIREVPHQDCPPFVQRTTEPRVASAEPQAAPEAAEMPSAERPSTESDIVLPPARQRRLF
jgi:hypothetical protein